MIRAVTLVYREWGSRRSAALLLLTALAALCGASPAYSVDIPLGEALDGAGLEWTTKGNVGGDPWFGQDAVSHDGVDAAESGELTDDQTNSVSVTVGGPGRVSFWWKVSSEEEFDWLRFTINNVEMTRISGEVDWQELSFDVPPGRQTLVWLFHKNDTVTEGLDRAWVDEVEYLPDPAPRPPETLEVCLAGCPFGTIQGAVDAAVGGDTILVHEGTYTEFIHVYGKPLTIRSVSGAAGTIITPPSEGTVFTVDSVWPLPVVLEGFTIMNGGGEVNHSLQFMGGALSCLDSALEVVDSVLTENMAQSGAGIHAYYCTMAVRGTTISDNTGRGIDWMGNSYYGDTLLIEDSTISRNNVGACGLARCAGGGIDARYGGSATITGSLIEDNHSDLWGGGIYASIALTIRGSTIRGNSTPLHGGGIFNNGALIVEDSSIVDNFAENHGGGVDLDAGPDEDIVFRRSVVAGNEAGVRGGGLIIASHADVDIINSVISGNKASVGGSAMRIGTAPGGDPGSHATLNLVNSTVAGNGLDREDQAIEVYYTDPAVFRIVNSIVHGNGPIDPGGTKFSGDTIVSHSNVTGGWAGEGNIDADPLFVDPRPWEEAPTAEGSYNLLPASPAIDTGTDDTAAWPLLPDVDIDGHPRPQGPLPDMGADEHVFRGDWNGDGSPDIFWRHLSGGDTALWHMSGRTVVDGIAMPSAGSLEWSVASTDDFNGDGRPDLLWRNGVSGANHLWYLDGPAVTGDDPLPSVGAPWTLAGTADFDIDGDPDLLWRNTASGTNYIWYMEGALYIGGAPLPAAGPEWQLAAADDFSGDGRPDLMWRHGTSGLNFIWHLDGTTVTDCIPLPAAGSDWDPGMAADFNGDGSPDLLWRNTVTGANYLWHLVGGTVTGGDPVLPLADTGWRIEP